MFRGRRLLVACAEQWHPIVPRIMADLGPPTGAVAADLRAQIALETASDGVEGAHSTRTRGCR